MRLRVFANIGGTNVAAIDGARFGQTILLEFVMSGAEVVPVRRAAEEPERAFQGSPTYPASAANHPGNSSHFNVRFTVCGYHVPLRGVGTLRRAKSTAIAFIEYAAAARIDVVT